jgi:hypothetical protein
MAEPLWKIETHLFVCSWCDREIRGGPETPGQVVNFGLCRKCLRREKAALSRVSLQAVPSPGAQGAQTPQPPDSEKR